MGFLLAPVLGFLAVAGILGGIYFKIQHDAKAALLVKIEREKDDANEKARLARERIRTLCDTDPTNCIPADWFRD